MKLKMKSISAAILFGTMLSSPVIAFSETTQGNYFEAIGAVGAANLRANDGNIGITSSETDKLVQTNQNKWKTIDAQVGAGYFYYFKTSQNGSLQILPSIEPQLNLYYLYSNDGLRGNVLRYGDAAYNQLTYQIPVRSTRLMFDVALTLLKKSQSSLYIKAGVGNAWTRLTYSDVVNPDSVADCVNLGINLKASTRSHFAWELGVGVMQDINDRVSLTFEYLYTNFGNISTSASSNSGTAATSASSPATFSMYAQTLALGLHYAI